MRKFDQEKIQLEEEAERKNDQEKRLLEERARLVEELKKQLKKVISNLLWKLLLVVNSLLLINCYAMTQSTA